MAQVGTRGRRGSVSAWVAVACAVASGAAGMGAHALMASQGVQIERAQEDAVEEPVDGTGELAAMPTDDGDGGTGGSVEVAKVPVVVVHIDGAVAAEGVYELAGDVVRVADAVDAAGGATAEADLSAVNLAAPVADGDKVHIPAEGEEAAVVTGGVYGASAGKGASSGDRLVNINTASVDELVTLPGIGEATANAIIEDRERLGPFSSTEDLMRVSGIGQKKYERVRDLIRV